MVKEKRILSYFFSWLVMLLIICFVGISNVFAISYENLGNLIDITVLYGSPDYTSGPIELPSNETLYLKEITNLTYMVNNYNFKGNTHYQLESHLAGVTLTNANKYEVTDGSGNKCLISYEYSIFYGDYPRWNFQCPYDTNAISISISNSNNEYLFNEGNFRWTSAILSKADISISSGDENVDNIINNDNQNTQNIINNNNQNTQDIINSNKETQEVIKEQFNTCRDSVNLLNLGTFIEGYVDLASGILLPNANSYSYYFKTSDLPDTITFSSKNGNRSNISYWNNKPTISGQSVIYGYPNFTDKVRTINVDKNYEYILIQFSYNSIPEEIQVQSGTVVTEYERPGEKICTNKLDDTNDKLNEIQGALTDSSAPNMEILGDSAGWLPAGPLDSVLNLPLTMMNNLLTGLGKTCSTLRVELPFVKKMIEIPCISQLMEEMGAISLWRWVGRIASVLILYSYLMNLYAWADKVLTLRAEFDEAMGADLANWGRL